METHHLVSPSQQRSSTPVGFGQGFLSKQQCDNTPPCLAPVDFYLFSRLKSALKGRRFFAIINNAKEELKRLSQNGLQECFQHICSRWQKYIVATGDCFERNVA
jgi:hypothetical protein